MKYLVFVDFDGVLTTTRQSLAQHNAGYEYMSVFDPIAIEFFNRIHHTYADVSFVWSTSWRNHVPPNAGSIEHIVYSMWYNAGFRGT